MQGHRIAQGAALIALALLALTPTPTQAGSQDPQAAPLAGEVVPIATPRSQIEIAERFAKVIQFPEGIVRVDGFDPTVLSVIGLAKNSIRLSALDQGVTTLVATGEKQTFTIEVLVTGDARLLQSVLKRTYPNTAVSVMKVRDSVLLRGWVSEPQQISEIADLAKLYYPRVLNQMKVGGPQEVQLRVQVMEVQRTLTRKFGVNFVAGGKNATFASSPGPITPLSSLLVPLGGPATANLATTGLKDASMALGIATDNFVFQGLIQAMKNEGLLKILAEPVLVTRSGEPARLINGGEFPIPVPNGLGTITIEWREFGTLLEALPIVIGPTRLKQQITAEVSDRDFTSAVTLNGTSVPGLSKRTVQTGVEMEFGQTLVIAGLISTRYTAQHDKLPFLGELPGVGAAFRRTRYDTAEVEMLVMITPEYVSPLSPDQVPPGGPGLFSTVPTDRELYCQGLVEVPNYGDRCLNGQCPPASCPPGQFAPQALPNVPAIVPGPAAIPPMAVPVDPGDPQLILPPAAGPAALPPPPAGIEGGAAMRSSRPGAPLIATTRTPLTPKTPLPKNPPPGRVSPAGYRTEAPDDGLIEPASTRPPVSAARPRP